MKPIILAIDQSTTGSKAVLMDSDLNILAQASYEFHQHYPKPGWVEHDLEEIWRTVVKAIQTAMEKAKATRVHAIGITNQRETLCFWNRKTNEPVTRAIVWQDRRTADICEKMKKKGLEKHFKKKTGLILDPYFSGTKAAWALKNIPSLKTLQRQGQLAAGTIDSYLIARLTGGKVHRTEPSNASRTLAFDIHKMQFDKDLCKMFGVPLDLWPEVVPSNGMFGHTSGVPGLQDGIPITGVLGDQQAALFGQMCFDRGNAKCTFGTGAFLLMNVGNKPIVSRSGLLSTVAWQLDKEKPVYAMEGSAFIAGAAVQWLRDELRIISDSSEVERLAAEVSSTDGVFFIPALTGLGAPYWDAHAKGLICGITRGTGRSHLARAVLEGIAFQNVELLQAMENDVGIKIKALNVDGGAARNSLLMQIQSNLLGRKIRRPQMVDTTLLGAVFAAGLGAGVWSNPKSISEVWKLDREFNPELKDAERKKRLLNWRKAVERALSP